MSGVLSTIYSWDRFSHVTLILILPSTELLSMGCCCSWPFPGGNALLWAETLCCDEAWLQFFPFTITRQHWLKADSKDLILTQISHVVSGGSTEPLEMEVMSGYHLVQHPHSEKGQDFLTGAACSILICFSCSWMSTKVPEILEREVLQK